MAIFEKFFEMNTKKVYDILLEQDSYIVPKHRIKEFFDAYDMIKRNVEQLHGVIGDLRKKNAVLESDFAQAELENEALMAEIEHLRAIHKAFTPDNEK
jgi:regulator of replication initiation timing